MRVLKCILKILLYFVCSFGITRRKDRYLLQGEVASDLTLMRYILNNAA